MAKTLIYPSVKLVILTCLSQILVISCVNQDTSAPVLVDNNLKTDSTLKKFENDTIGSVETLEFSEFSRLFTSTNLPYVQEYNALWDGHQFFDENRQDYNYDDCYISYEILKEWVLPYENELSEKIKDVEKGLKDRDDDWYSIHAGAKFIDEGLNNFVIHFYEKTSEINGAYWYTFLLSFNSENRLTSCINLGREGLYTFTVMEETEELSFWQRQTDSEEMNIHINSVYDITSCKNSKTEIDGDLTEEQKNQIDQVNVIQDSLITWMEIHKKECKTFKL